jgi:hypothetical protein
MLRVGCGRCNSSAELLSAEDSAGVGAVAVVSDGVPVHAGAINVPEARSWKYVPEGGVGIEGPKRGDDVTLGDLTEEMSI